MHELMRFGLKQQKDSRLYSVLKCKCPRCREGDLFLSPNPWRLKKMLAMPDRCPVCGQDFRMEPGFYSGALWTSYPIVVLTDLAMLSPLLFYPAYIGWICAAMITTSLLLQPVIMRWGRAIWIHLFVRYEPHRAPKG